jgi:histidine ammonia-lyase
MSAVETEMVEIGARPPTIEDVCLVADGAPVRLSPDVRQRIAESRAVVDSLVSGETLIYGLNTGLGHMRDERVPIEALRTYQEAIVAGHAGGLGAPLPARIVRAAMFARLTGVAGGGSGLSPVVADQLVEMLNRGVSPILAEIGSVGASDLMHMAAIGQVVIGTGRAEVEGEILGGSDALRRVGLQPVVLEPKDGLALISANGVSVGRSALVVARARILAEIADLVVALSLEAIHGNISIVDPAVASAKGIDGQSRSSERIRGLLAGSERCTPGAAASVQDPLSFRVAPQVHGAFREALQSAAQAVEAELRAMDDNPLVVAAEGRMVSNGNFHPIAMALAVDALRPAIAHVGQLSDRRMGHLWGPLMKGLVADLTASPDTIASATPLLRYAAATRVAEMRELAGPVTLDIGPLDLGVEDHSTNAPVAASRTEQALLCLLDVLASETLIDRRILDTDELRAALGGGTRAALEDVDDALATGSPNDEAGVIHRRVKDRLVVHATQFVEPSRA